MLIVILQNVWCSSYALNTHTISQFNILSAEPPNTIYDIRGAWCPDGIGRLAFKLVLIMIRSMLVLSSVMMPYKELITLYTVYTLRTQDSPLAVLVGIVISLKCSEMLSAIQCSFTVQYALPLYHFTKSVCARKTRCGHYVM